MIKLKKCIPVVTIGAATTALYYVSAKVLRHNRSYVFREFWHAFKSNFLQSTIVWVITLVLTVLLIFNIQLVTSGYMVGAYLALLFIILCVSCYLYPIVSRFATSMSQILRLSLYCAFRHFLHTLALIGILAAAVALIYLGVVTNIILVIIFVPGLAGFCYTFPMEHVMKKYMPKKDPVYDEDGKEILEWYEE